MFWKIVLGFVGACMIGKIVSQNYSCNFGDNDEENDRYFNMDGVPRNFDPNQVYGNYHNTKF